MKKNTIEALIKNIKILGEDDCWLYSGPQKPGKNGHIEIRINGPKKGTYVWAYEHFVGPVPKGLCVCHKCDNPRCCNPKHLFIGTKGDNSRDRDSKGRNWMANRTHCKNGHEFAVVGFYDYGKGRVCKACSKNAHKQYYDENKTRIWGINSY